MRAHFQTDKLAYSLFWLAIWTDLLAHLAHDWTLNPQYTYGWGVPFLVVYLAWQRWLDAPPQGRPTLGPAFLLISILLIVVIFPLRLVREANPDWRPLNWLSTFVLLGLSLIEIYRQGGPRYVKHFAYSLAFILTALPWPSFAEQTLIQNLMKLIAVLASEILNWFGIPAMPAGNLIRLPNGLLGVDQACSGVRSLQTSVMVSLFLGELNRFHFIGRTGLLGIGLVSALLTNLIRAFILSWIAAKQGMDAISNWHDPAGYLSTGATLLSIMAAAHCLKPHCQAPPSKPRQRKPAFHFRPLRPAFITFGLSCLLFSGVFTEVWYRSGETRLSKTSPWHFDETRGEGRYQTAEIPEAAPALMRYQTGKAVHIRQPDNSDWLVYYFEWDAGRSSAMLARSHSPEICLPSTGLQQIGTTTTRTLQVDKRNLTFRSYTFEHRQRLLHVFFCLEEDYLRHNGAPQQRLDLNRRNRLRAVLQKRRHRGQRVLEIAISGHETLDDAWKNMQKFLPPMIQDKGLRP